MSGNDIWTIPNDDRRSIRIDLPFANIRYVGRAESVNASTSLPIWMIRREYKNGTETVIEFANFSSYSAIWDDRTTYFPAATGDNNNPLDPASSSGGGGGGGYGYLPGGWA